MMTWSRPNTNQGPLLGLLAICLTLCADAPRCCAVGRYGSSFILSGNILKIWPLLQQALGQSRGESENKHIQVRKSCLLIGKRG